MQQIFILGSSSAYGVGATNGWGDLIKQYLHDKMYGNNGVGEKYEVYNFAKAGATIDFVHNNFPQQLKQYGRNQAPIAIVCVGGNNSKADNTPDNFVSTIEDYLEQMDELFSLLKENCSHVISVGNGFVDESKTNPKPNPLTGGKSYFSNERRKGFSDRTKQLCEQKDIAHVEVTVPMQEWIDKYLYKDGLHSNQAGHQLIFEAIKQVLDPLITD